MWHVWVDRINTYRILVGNTEGKRERGKPRRRREDNVNIYLQISTHHFGA
jgi:hypothetical protein